MKKIIYIISVLAVLLCPAKAQDASQNYVRIVTMLNAERTDSVQAVQYYNGLGYPTLSAVTAGSNGETAYSLTTYDALGREERKYLPVAIGYSMDYKTPADIASASASANTGDGTAYSQNHHDALDRVISVELPGRAWRNTDRSTGGQTPCDKFVNGTGPEFSVMLDDHPYTEAIKNDDFAKESQDIVRSRGENGKYTNAARGEFFPWQASLTNPMQFIGTYRYDGYSSKDGRNINNVATDSKSITSLGYHIPFLKNHRRSKSKSFGTTYQFYIWRSRQ